MKHILRSTLIMTTFLTISSVYAIAPLITPRSQSEDSARELAGWAHQVNLYDQECLYGSWAMTLEYTRSFRSNDIAECLFGSDLVDSNDPFITISGSQVGNREATDWLADYFGLPPDFKSTVNFNPRVENILLDLNFYLGLDSWLNGLYFRIHAPICYSRWSLNAKETIQSLGVLGYGPGYFNGTQTGVPRGQLVNSFLAYANGKVPNLQDPNPAPTIPAPLVIFDSLQHAQISTKRHSKTRLSDIQAALGWNFLQAEDHHFGLNARMAAPTGNRPEGEFLFEPIVGNGHHWELGLGVTAHYLLWINRCNNTSIGFYFDGNVTHLFGTKQQRTFDLVQKPLSRYMLVERLGTPVTNLFANPAQGTADGSTAPSSQFQNFFTPLANLTTLDVNVSIAAQTDITAMLNIQYNCFNLDIGYNYWARSCEKIKFINTCGIPFNGTSNKGLYALKGDAQVYGFIAQDAATPPPPLVHGSPVALSATESLATIHAGTNTPIGAPFVPANLQNPNIDNPQYAIASTTDATDQIVILPTDFGGMNTQQRTSLNPVFITTTNIDLEGAETKGGSNKIFAHLSYDWHYCADWVPYIGLGGFVEFAHHNEKNCRDQVEDNSCQDCAFSQWGMWLKGGVSF